jgi:hypothetical protein
MYVLLDVGILPGMLFDGGPRALFSPILQVSAHTKVIYQGDAASEQLSSWEKAESQEQEKFVSRRLLDSLQKICPMEAP